MEVGGWQPIRMLSCYFYFSSIFKVQSDLSGIADYISICFGLILFELCGRAMLSFQNCEIHFSWKDFS